MKKVTKGIVVTVVGLSAVFALAGFRSGSFGGHCRGGNVSPEQAQKWSAHFVDGVLDDIDATDAQRAQAHSLKDGLLKQGLEMRDLKNEDRKEMLRIWESANPDAQAVHARVDARIETLRAFAHQAADAALEMHQTLTPEQRAELAAMIRERHGNN